MVESSSSNVGLVLGEKVEVALLAELNGKTVFDEVTSVEYALNEETDERSGAREVEAVCRDGIGNPSLGLSAPVPSKMDLELDGKGGVFVRLV
jgi:hypothetical protein